MKILPTPLFHLTLGILAIWAIANPPSQAQQCQALPVVGGRGTQVAKKVSAPGIPLIRNNWNTDFEVPFNRSFTSFQATIKTEDPKEAQFNVSMSLKYSDDTADQTFKGAVKLAPGQSRYLTGNPRVGQQPYQINLNVGSLEAAGTAYRLSVKGCR